MSLIFKIWLHLSKGIKSKGVGLNGKIVSLQKPNDPQSSCWNWGGGRWQGYKASVIPSEQGSQAQENFQFLRSKMVKQAIPKRAYFGG